MWNRMRRDNSRRRFVKRVGAVALVGGLAGCVGDGDDGTDTPSDTGTETGTETTTRPTTPTPTPTPEPTPTPTPPQTPEGRADDYLTNVGVPPNYDGSIEDLTGQSSVTVGVGDGGQVFEPPAIRISAGTTVTWDWVNGNHNVVTDNDYLDLVSEEDQFRSGSAQSGDVTFERTFETGGKEFPYYCEPHVGLMHGYIIVEA